jgi:hypothetical protein
VPQSAIDKHKKDGVKCIRCGRDSHKMYDCYAKKAVGGEDLEGKAKTSAATKRKQDDDDDNDNDTPPPPTKNKKAKTAAVRNEDVTMSDAHPRIWELDSDDESDF